MVRNLLLILLICCASAHAKIYDCFMYFNEWEVVEIRFNELYDHVDKFVVVEASESFRGLRKKYNFEAEKERFEKFADKIIYIKVGSRNFENEWIRENFQKNQIIRGLTGCKPDDLILFSDCDEIPSQALIADLAEAIKTTPVIGIRQRFYRHFLNRRVPECGAGEELGWWVGTLAIRYDYLQTTTPNSLRTAICFGVERSIPYLGGSVSVPIWEGGWHFSSMGGFEKFLVKYSNWTHWRNPYPKTYEAWRSEVDGHPLEPIDGTYPDFVQDNFDYLIEIGMIDVP